MGAATKIEWTATVRADGSVVPGYTFNPWWGCVKVSPGCAHCYAEAFDRRTHGTERHTDARGVVREPHWGNDAPRRFFGDAHWRQPIAWNRAAEKAGERRRVFCASMADVFEDRPDLVAPRARLFALIDATPTLDWLLLSKRPENIGRLLVEAADWGKANTSLDHIALREWGQGHGQPFPNVWLGTTVENQEQADLRIPLLLQVPAAVRFLSVEPMLGPVDLSPWLVYNPVHEQRPASGGVGPGCGAERGSGDRSRRPNLEAGEAGMGSLEGRAGVQAVREVQGGARTPERLSPGSGNDQRGPRERVGAPPRLESPPRTDPAWSDAQSPERDQGRQPAVQSGSSDAVGERAARFAGPAGRTLRDSGRWEQPRGETLGGGRRNDPAATSERRETAEDCGGLRGERPDCVEDRARSAVGISWTIVGGESGPGARPCDVAWIRSVVRQCREAGVPCFVKQVGAVVHDRNDAGFDAMSEVWADGPDAGQPTNPSAWPEPIEVEDAEYQSHQGAAVRVRLRDPKGGDPLEWPSDLRVREFPGWRVIARTRATFGCCGAPATPEALRGHKADFAAAEVATLKARAEKAERERDEALNNLALARETSRVAQNDRKAMVSRCEELLAQREEARAEKAEQQRDAYLSGREMQRERAEKAEKERDAARAEVAELRANPVYVATPPTLSPEDRELDALRAACVDADAEWRLASDVRQWNQERVHLAANRYTQACAALSAAIAARKGGGK